MAISPIVSAGSLKALAGAPPAASAALPQPAASAGTAPSSTPINAADLDTLRLAGTMLPGVWTVEPSQVGPKLTKRGADAKGRSGAKVDADGIQLMQLSITGKFWELDQVDVVKSLLVPLVRPSNPKAIAPVAIDCWITRIYAISTVVLEDAPGPKHDGKGVYSWTIKASEFRVPAAAGGGSVGLNGKTSPRGKNVGLNELIELNAQLTQLAGAYIGKPNPNAGLAQNLGVKFWAPPSATVQGPGP